MNANDELNAAVTRRIERENLFKGEIIANINRIIASLALCDPTNAASTLDLSQDQLRQVIAKLDAMDNINSDQSQLIADTLNGKNLRRGLEPVQAAVPAAVAPAPTGAWTGATPAAVTTPPKPGFLNTLAAASMGTTPQQMAQKRRGGGKTRRRRKTRR